MLIKKSASTYTKYNHNKNTVNKTKTRKLTKQHKYYTNKTCTN